MQFSNTRVRVSVGIVIGLATLLLVNAATANNKPKLSTTDRVRLAEAFRLADSLGNRLWPGWDRAPFAVLLITPQHEFLVRHPSPSKDFASLGKDCIVRLTGCYSPVSPASHFSKRVPRLPLAP